MPAPPIRPEGPLPATVAEKFIEAGGVRFRYLISKPAGRPEDGAVLLLHGFGARSEIWLPTFADLAPRTVIALDLPCHGKSGMLPGKDRRIGSYRSAMDAFVDALPFQRLTVLGSSLGGALGAMLALDRPLRIERLVLLGASGLTPKLPGKTVRLYLPYILPAYLFAPTPRAFASFLRKGVFHDPRWVDENWTHYLSDEWKSRPRRSSYLATASAMTKPDASVAADLERISCPTLLLWGREDAHFDWKDGEAASKKMPQARFICYEGCGHLPMIEKARETTSDLQRFLGEGPAASPSR
ncbi:MAG: alpha/beta fold hydrolase [Euryarchaeota archaeon]|nr:alpha/beta fold hydrolase [Euryarchaeota archaeon]MDE1837061.1 alpha/beta fold hydrolase [Euryarchaeota archaeon]MDE1880992.1 alpha/beta fold hydrolase [Euryarchaeota archaeon]MDE2046373.1 alpha/beta fold hydrolase [Thermoplasmata archaeon]